MAGAGRIGSGPVDVRFAVLASGAGSNLRALLDHPVVGPAVVLVVSDRPEAGALAVARARSVAAEVVDPAGFGSRDGFDAALIGRLEEAGVDAVLLAGFMRILGPAFVRAFAGRILNVHPSLLPAFPGAAAVRDALAWGTRVTGVTVHVVDEEVDHGPIVLQEAVAVLPDDDEETLHRRIKDVEHRLFPRAAELLGLGRLKVEGRRVHLVHDEPARVHGLDDGAARDELPDRATPVFERVGGLRYGENPHQRAAVYASAGGSGPLGGAEVLQGKEMSYNNWLDAEAARALAGLFAEPVAVIMKHHNPCGVALGPTLAHAYRRALEGDRVSAFGGIVAFNAEVDEAAAEAMAGVFTEVVVAPSYTAGALERYAGRSNLRVVRAPLAEPGGLELRPIDGGALVQDMDTIMEGASDMKVVTGPDPTPERWRDLLFAWTVAARTKSNAIVLASDGATVGIGAGQMNRVTSVDIAIRQAGDRARGSCLASDAFFPFRDSLDRAAEAGIAAVIQPGGSVRDDEVVSAAEEHGFTMVLTGRRHFRH
jgi:phosphoribosylglycinamide/phosphoribosylaminoimidazolecarboxamide formyltransferase